jgi:hypothetical protein
MIGDVATEVNKVLTKLRASVKKIGDAKGELGITMRDLGRIDKKIRRLPSGVNRAQFSGPNNAAIAAVKLMDQEGDGLQKRANDLFEKIKKETGLTAGLGRLGTLPGLILSLLAAVAVLLGLVTLFWTKVVNGTKKLNLQSRALEARVAGLLPPGVNEEIDRQERGSGGGFSIGGVPMVVLGVLLLVFADRFRGTGGGGGSVGAGGFSSLR